MSDTKNCLAALRALYEHFNNGHPSANHKVDAARIAWAIETIESLETAFEVAQDNVQQLWKDKQAWEEWAARMYEYSQTAGPDESDYFADAVAEACKPYANKEY